MDIDQLFKVPKLPVGANKRRMPDNPTPEMLKRMKLDNQNVPLSQPPAPSPSNGSGKNRSATVQDEDDENSGSFAPGDDADYFVEEDEEGRFFGGGLTEEQKKILNIFDSVPGTSDADDLEITAIRRILLRLDRAINKNQDQRSKYPDDPTKFIDSEADLDSALKSLLPMSQSAMLAYPELVRSGTLSKLVGLLTHENVDIVIGVVDVFFEFTDEDADSEALPEDERQADSLKVLVDGLIESSALELLAENLRRFNETEESDRQGLFHVLGIFENLLAFRPTLSDDLVARTDVLPWLLNRVAIPEPKENRGYSAELLSILLQNNRVIRLQFGKHDGVEALLKILSHFRKRDPVDAEETEFMENLFDALCSALAEPEIKQLLLDAEGVDLMVLMMKERRQSRIKALKVLDHAMSTSAGAASCTVFVEALGLKSLFSALMGHAKSIKKGTKVASEPVPEEVGHILSILSSLFSNLGSETPERIRLLAKFVEANYEKVDRILEVREGAVARLAATDKEIAEERKARGLEDSDEMEEDQEEIWYLRRLENGLFTLQTVDYILTWLAMEDDGIKAHISAMLQRRSKSLKDLVVVLKETRDNVDESVQEAEGPSQRQILSSLIQYLESS
ncbi:DUF1716-domain-containing protein [Sistotremastrum niveocremeum HHB9708]|uniref:DUF1716-domain-containing protein n=1 Tax=Sistotremastrum niveocremeum HHB9708 TaxID=1314777 RepID=A0A164ZGA9_9AGAM|nr:DUF1716-domain-containing protein [Sistotremastrum niveocremeum HHB9708]